MTPLLWIALGIGFALGVPAGFFARAWLEGRRTVQVTLPIRSPHERHNEPVPTTPGRRRLIIILVLLSVLLSASANVLQIRNGQADKQRDQDYRDQVSCNTEYNKLDGIARDDRNGAATTSTSTELDFLRAIRDQTVNPTGDQAAQLKRFLDTIDARITSLEAVEDSRDANPYPDPEGCADGVMTDDERVGK